MIWAALLILAGSPDVWASDQVWTPQSGRYWTTADTAREAVFGTLLAIDMDYTVDNGLRCREANPILGRCPTESRIVIYGSACLLLHASIAAVLPKPYRRVWQDVWISGEAGSVGLNVYFGSKFRF
jgi:hypothetical protein